MDIVTIALGWPAALPGTISLVAGVASRNVRFAALGLLISSGFLIYVALNPLPFGALGIAALFGSAAAVVSTHRRMRRLASLFLIPQITLLVVLLVGVWR